MFLDREIVKLVKVAIRQPLMNLSTIRQCVRDQLMNGVSDELCRIHIKELFMNNNSCRILVYLNQANYGVPWTPMTFQQMFSPF